MARPTDRPTLFTPAFWRYVADRQRAAHVGVRRVRARVAVLPPSGHEFLVDPADEAAFALRTRGAEQVALVLVVEESYLDGGTMPLQRWRAVRELERYPSPYRPWQALRWLDKLATALTDHPPCLYVEAQTDANGYVEVSLNERLIAGDPPWVRDKLLERRRFDPTDDDATSEAASYAASLQARVDDAALDADPAAAVALRDLARQDQLDRRRDGAQLTQALSGALERGRRTGSQL